MWRRIMYLCACFAMAVVLILPARTWANSAPPRWVGDTGGVLVPGSSDQVHIRSELLRFDLQQGLAQAQVTARYEMENRGAKLDGAPVVFALQDTTDETDQAVTVTWNGQPVAVSPVPLENLPAAQRDQVNQAWGASGELIDPVTGEVYPAGDLYGQSTLKLVQFQLAMDAGATGVLEVSYRHDAATERNRHANWVHAYQYLLLPARSWASFGPLEIQVKVPEQVFFRSNLPLAEANGEYRARFETLPQANLVFAVMSRQGIIGDMADTGPYYLIAFVLFVALAFGLGWGLGWLSGGMRTRGWAIGLGVLLGLVVGGVGDLLLSFASHLIFQPLRNDSYGSIIIVFAQWLVVGVPLTAIVAAVKAARRHRARLTYGQQTHVKREEASPS